MDYVILSMILLAIGIYGLLSKHHMLKIVVSIEVIATAASMNFVLLASSLSRELGQAFLILAFSTDTVVTAVILSLLVTVSKKYGICDIRKLTELEENEKTAEENN